MNTTHNAAICIYYTKDWEPLSNIVMPRVYRYCEKHGYDSRIRIGYDKNTMDKFGESVGLEKMKYLKSILSLYDFVWVLDLDTFITNHEIKFTDFVDNSHDIFITEDIHGINAGSWIARNTKKCLEFIDCVINHFNAPEEQTIMKRYLHRVNVRYLPHPSINSYDYNYYRDEIGDRVIESYDGQWSESDLILHMPGTTIEQRIERFFRLLNK